MWPRAFSRYILREVLGLSMIMLLGSTMIIMFGVVMHKLVESGLGLKAFLQMLPYATVVSLQFAVPSTLLFAVCAVYGRMAADNELTAVKSAGVHPFRVVVPVYILGLVVSPFVVWLNDIAVSWGRIGLNRVVLHSVEEIVYGFLRSQKVFVSQNLTISVNDVEGRWLISPVIQLRVDDDTKEITAEKAAISLNEANETLVIELVNWQWDSGKNLQMSGGAKTPIRFELPLTMAAKKAREATSISELPLSSMPAARSDLVRETNLHEQAVLARSARSMLTGQFVMFNDPIMGDHRFNLKDVSKKTARLNQEPWRRWALGFSCFSFVFVGVPWAIHLKNANYATTFVVCFLPVLFVYYPLFALGVDQAKSGNWPPYSPFLSNIVMLLIGVYFLRRIYRS
jgi:lipopolysaccharide export system permease protein